MVTSDFKSISKFTEHVDLLNVLCVINNQEEYLDLDLEHLLMHDLSDQRDECSN